MGTECPTPVSALNEPGGTEGIWLTPQQWQLPQPTVGPSHSHPDPRQKPVSMRAAKQTNLWEATPVIPFMNLDLTAYLVGWSNDTPVIVDWQKVTALINSGARVSSIYSGFCECMTLKVHPLGRLLELVGTRDSAFQYLGYVEFIYRSQV